MTLSAFSVPAARRYFEDYIQDAVYEFGGALVTEADILDYARLWDPQSFHVDPEAAKKGRFGGLIASGWHTAAIAMRMLVDHYLSEVASMASPGVDELRWPAPVRPGDTLRVRVTTVEAKPSRTKNDRGMVRAKVEALNQRDEVVLSMLAMCIVARRPADAASANGDEAR